MAQPRLATLADIEAAVWQQLARAPRDKHHEWRTAVLATASVDGADARTVVLREVDASARQLMIYTDSRAGKVAQLRAQPHGTLVLWSARLGWQLRCRLACTVHEAGLAVASRWERLKLTRAAHDYLSLEAPGQVSAGAEGAGETTRMTPPLALSERACFAIIEAQVLEIDWLELHPEGHRRARFDSTGRHWLVP